MNEYKKAIHDVKTGETEILPMNKKEIEVIKRQQAELELEKLAEAEKLASRESAKSKLTAIGLTDEEIAALVGA